MNVTGPDARLFEAKCWNNRPSLSISVSCGHLGGGHRHTRLITWEASTAMVCNKCSAPQIPLEHLHRYTALQTGVKTRTTCPCPKDPPQQAMLPCSPHHRPWCVCSANKQTLWDLMMYSVLLTLRGLKSRWKRQPWFRAPAPVTGPQWFYAPTTEWTTGSVGKDLVLAKLVL